MKRLLAGTFGAVMALLPAADTAAEPHARALTAPQWQAVGRLDFGGASWCTGALIAEDLVLTAAHCLFDHATGRRYLASEISFRAGLRGDTAAAERGVRQAVADPGFTYSDDDQLGRIAHDVALLRLDAPIHDIGISPFETTVRPRKGDELGIVSYAQSRPEDPGLQPACVVMARQGGLLVLDCAAAPGASGSPIFEMDGDTPRIVSVVSAMATVGEHDVSLGTALTRPLAYLETAMADAETAPSEPVRLVQAGLSRNPAVAASFLRTGN